MVQKTLIITLLLLMLQGLREILLKKSVWGKLPLCRLSKSLKNAEQDFLTTFIRTLLLGSGKAGRKEDDREELDFQFDEEIVTPKHNRWVNN